MRGPASADLNLSTPNPPSQTSLTISGVSYDKHGTHWYDDGNLIILVEKVAFRVFQSFLTRRSLAMESALAVPPPKLSKDAESPTNSHSETVDGAFIVQLDDRASDFGLLLDVVLPQTCAMAPISTKTPWDTLLGLARIAQKYELSDVVSHTIALLENVLPTLDRPHRTRSPVHAAIIIQWARECGFHQFLPMAFYYLVTGEWQFNPTNLRAMESLSARDQLRAQCGLAQLQATVLELALTRWENCPIGNSKPEKRCPSRRLICWMGYGDNIWPSRDDGTRWANLLLHPLAELRMRAECNVATLSWICPSCQWEFIAANRLMVTDILKELEKIFTLRDELYPYGVAPPASK